MTGDFRPEGPVRAKERQPTTVTTTAAPAVPSRNRRQPLATVLQAMSDGQGDVLDLVRDLVRALEPRTRFETDEALHNWQTLLALLRETPAYRHALAENLFTLLAQRDQRAFYTESGLLPNTGFFSELRQILARKLLPDPLDASNFRDGLHLLFAGRREFTWLQAIPPEEREVLWSLLAHEVIGSDEHRRRIREQVLESAVVLAHRIAAMGLEPELLRTVPRLTRGESAFVALCNEVTQLAASLRSASRTERAAAADASHLHVLLAQCRDAVDRVHQTAVSRGTSFSLTFLVVRLRQHLERLELLFGLLTEPDNGSGLTAPVKAWSLLVEGAIEQELHRDHLRRHAANLTALVALRVTENAGRTGEHYIAANSAEWYGIWRAAAGAGFLIAFMAFLKIFGGNLNLALINQGLLNGVIYAGGFVIIHLCHGTVATKQPALTAATIAATVSHTRGRLREIDQLADLVVATFRSQYAAILGNVLIALPLAIALTLAVQAQSGGAMIAPVNATIMLDELHPLGGAPLFAAIAGVWLFMAGLVSGLVDNQAAYSRLGARIACHPGLTRLFGATRAAQLGRYLDRNAGGLAGNIFFGMMLGLTPAIGLATGLPLDIRHIAFSVANFGYALTSLDFQVAPLTILRAAAGVAVIGLLNLVVSFSLALWVALRSRGVDFVSAAALLPLLARRFRNKPARFFTPSRNSAGEG